MAWSTTNGSTPFLWGQSPTIFSACVNVFLFAASLLPEWLLSLLAFPLHSWYLTAKHISLHSWICFLHLSALCAEVVWGNDKSSRTLWWEGESPCWGCNMSYLVSGKRKGSMARLCPGLHVFKVFKTNVGEGRGCWQSTSYMFLPQSFSVCPWCPKGHKFVFMKS